MILALDTATRQAGVALYDGDHVRYECVWHNTDKFHTEWLVPAIEYAFQQVGIGAKDLTAVAVAKGPGSYTGIRVAMSVAKGLVAALDIPIVGVNALDVLAWPFLDEGQTVCAAVPLGRGRFAYHFYWITSEPEIGTYPAPPLPHVGNAQAISSAINTEFPRMHVKVVGEFTRGESQQFGSDQGYMVEVIEPPLAVRRPSILAMLAKFRIEDGETDDPRTLEPIYLQP